MIDIKEQQKKFFNEIGRYDIERNRDIDYYYDRPLQNAK